MPIAGSSDEVVFASLRDRGGRSVNKEGTGSGWNQDETLPRFTRSDRRFSMTAWRKLSVNSAVARERDKKGSTQSLFGGREHQT